MHSHLTLLLATAVRADWVNELKLTLANYALARSTSEPDGFKCTEVGKKHSSCHCWNAKGKPADEQTDDDCHWPPQCLMYDYKNSGDFRFTNISATGGLHAQLDAWSVPKDMYAAYDAAALVESSTFEAFHLDIEDHKAHFDAHVGTLRKYQGTLYFGYVAGTADGEMVQPMVRHVRAGDCHGTTRDMKPRGYTSDEVARIDAGLQAFAYREAAKRAQPSLLAAPPATVEAGAPLSTCSVCEEAISGLVSAGAGGACGAACGACGCEPCIPFCASICASIASGETDAHAICGSVHLCTAEAAAEEEEEPVEARMSEAAFLTKWAGIVSRLDAPPAEGRRQLQAGNPFALLLQAIQGITGAWQSIVNAFKSSYSEQIADKEFNNGWSKFKEATKVFKGAGLDYAKSDDFFADIQKMIGLPAKYKGDFDDQIAWIKFFDNVTWSDHNTQFSKGKGGTDSMFSMYARNRATEQKIDVLFLTCEQEFKLAPDYFVISESRSILGGLFSSTKLKFKKIPAGLQTAQLMFVSDYFSLLAYQQIALAEGMQAPPDPTFPPSPPLANAIEAK